MSIDLTQPTVIRRGTGDEKRRKPTLDEQLRQRGYRIVSRPTKGEPIWTNGMKNWKQSQIILTSD